MTFKEFKEYIELLGATDDTIMAYQDMNFGGIDVRICESDIDISRDKQCILLASKYWEPVE